MKRVCRVEGHINRNVAWMLRDSSEIEMDKGTARLASDILEPQPCGLKAPPRVSFLAYHQYCSFIASLGLSDFSRTHQARKRGCAWWPYPLYLCPCTVRVLVLTPYKINRLADALLRLTRPLYGSGEWSGREDLNLRPPAPEAGALNQTALRPDFKESGG
jgi:hypothetical protein